MSGDRNYTHILQLLGNFFSYIFTRNSIFDFAFKPLFKYCHTIFIQMGFSIVLLIAFFLFFVLIFSKKKEKEFSIVFYKSIFITLIICLLLPVKIPFTNFSLWYFVYKFFTTVFDIFCKSYPKCRWSLEKEYLYVLGNFCCCTYIIYCLVCFLLFCTIYIYLAGGKSYFVCNQ